MKKILAFVILLTLIQPPAVSGSSRLWPFEKKCLVELETATWCGYCPVAEKAVAQLQNEYDPSDLVVYALHFKDAFQNSHGKARMNEYGSVATPTAIFNGNTYHVGGDPQCKQAYTRKINEQLGFGSPFVASLSATVDGGTLVLKATAMAWKMLPDASYHYTFMIGETEAKAGGERAFWVMKAAGPQPLGTETSFNEFSTYEYEYRHPLGSTDPGNIYASFLIESFEDQNIFQNATWRPGNLQAESIDPVPGSVLEKEPEQLVFKFREKIRDASKWRFIDEDQNQIEAQVTTKDQTVTVKPKAKVKKGVNYYFAFEDGKAGIKSENGKFTNSPVFTHFVVKGQAEPPPPPPDPPKPPTPPEPRPAKLSVEPLGFNLGKIDRNAPTEFEFTVSNVGDGNISGTATPGCEHIVCEPSRFDKTPAKIRCKILIDKVLPGQDHKCVIDIESSAGMAKVGVNFSVPMRPPVLAFSPEILDFGSETGLPLRVTVTNNGEGNMVTKAVPDQPWIVVAPDSLVNSGEFVVAIDASALAPGKHAGKITIDSNGNAIPQVIPVTVTIPEPRRPVVIEMIVGNKLAIVDGNIVELKVAPQVIGGTTLVPFRFIAESFKAEVSWDQKTRTVTLEFRSKNLKVVMTEGKPEVSVIEKGQSRTEILTIPARNIGGSLCVPIRFFAQALGASTQWDSKTKKITITWLP